MADPRDALIAELRRELAALRAENAALKEELAKLREELGKSSNNSSKPPSTDGPKARELRKKKPPSGRKPGGQPGHERSTRPLAPIEDVTSVTVCRPERCEGCNRRLRGDDPSPVRHQVVELPQVKPVINEWQLHALGCTCGHVTRAELPDGVPTRCFGPTVDAAVATLLGVYRMSRRMVPDFLETFFGLRMSLGSVVKCQTAVSQALVVPVEEARDHARSASVKYCDETGWRERGARAFLWTVVTAGVTVFFIQARRTANAAGHALGKVHGLLGTDRHGAYNGWPDVARQFCWAHLIRAFVTMSERGGKSKRLARKLLAEKDQMFAWWHRVRDGTLSKASFRRYMKPLQDRFETHLEEGARTCAKTKTGRTCQKLRDHFDALWTFVYRDGIDPTNNAAERALRFAVILRKLTFGTHSPEGSRFLERMLTCHATLRQQDRNVLTFLTEVCQASLRRIPPPSLLHVTPATRSTSRRS